jgi:hypothetical protein
MKCAICCILLYRQKSANFMLDSTYSGLTLILSHMRVPCLIIVTTSSLEMEWPYTIAFCAKYTSSDPPRTDRKSARVVRGSSLTLPVCWSVQDCLHRGQLLTTWTTGVVPIRMVFHVSSSKRLVLWMTMFGRNRFMGIGSLPLATSRRLTSCKDDSQASSAGNPSVREDLGCRSWYVATSRNSTSIVVGKKFSDSRLI